MNNITEHRFNFNDRIKFKPTILAVEYLHNSHVEFWMEASSSARTLSQFHRFEQFANDFYLPRIDEEGYMNFALWEFMNKFGDLLTPGFDPSTFFLDYYLEIPNNV